MITQLLKIKCSVKNNHPLIHCITNPISINDCANIVLATGAKPIMAEHPKEVEHITKTAKALAVNLGNITDARMKSIMISGKTAKKNNIPSIIDVVGVGCSKLRLDYAKKYIKKNSPDIIKGNMSELKALSGISSHAYGIDAGIEDAVSTETLKSNAKIVRDFSRITGSIVVATGKTDIISDGITTYAVNNGTEMMADVTGTGCMLNVLIASYISSGDILEGAIMATTALGICGELACHEKGTGSFRTALLDNLYTLTEEQIIKNIKLEEIDGI